MRVEYSRRAISDLDRLFEFVARENPSSALAAVKSIVEAVEILRGHPLIGRPLRGGTRQLVISFGAAGYVALYRVVAARGVIDILTVRHQRESGPEE